MDIPENLLDITQNTKEGYHSLTEYDKWLVAVLNQGESNDSPDKVEYLEYHEQTNEVFILLKGRAMLFISGGKAKPEDIKISVMEPLKFYNVKKRAWHAIILQEDASVAIVENSNTSRKNSCYYYLSDSEKKILSEIEGI